MLTMYFTCVSECVYIFLCLHYKQYLCCWNGSTTSGGQALYSILSTLKKNPLGFIFPASAILLWCCSEICFHQADSIRELGNEKSAIELAEERKGWGLGLGGGDCGKESKEKLQKRKRVTLIQNEHIPPVFCTTWISLLDVLEIIQLNEVRLLWMNKRLKASGF